MQITERGYIVNNETGVVSGTWLVSGGTFVGFPGEDVVLKEALDTLRRDGIPSLTRQETPEGDVEFILSYKRSTTASIVEVGNTLAVMGYSLLSADEVEAGYSDDDMQVETEIARDDFDVWYEKRGYILSRDGRPISIWYMVGDVVNILATGHKELDTLVDQLKINGLSLLQRSSLTGELVGQSKIRIPWVEAFPIEIATALADNGFTMIPAMELESITKEDAWYKRGS